MHATNASAGSFAYSLTHLKRKKKTSVSELSHYRHFNLPSGGKSFVLFTVCILCLSFKTMHAISFPLPFSFFFSLSLSSTPPLLLSFVRISFSLLSLDSIESGHRSNQNSLLLLGTAPAFFFLFCSYVFVYIRLASIPNVTVALR